MKIRFLVIGKTHSEFNDLISTYASRLQRYIDFTIETIPDLKKGKKLSVQEVKTKEAELILDKVKANEVMVLLDERGKSFSSNEFAHYLQNKMNQSTKQLTFVVGGAYGFAPAVYQKAQGKISLSAMTFSHQMIRLFFVEQLYRGFTILNNEPYHHQ